jgi:hypothetical protein
MRWGGHVVHIGEIGIDTIFVGNTEGNIVLGRPRY